MTTRLSSLRIFRLLSFVLTALTLASSIAFADLIWYEDFANASNWSDAGDFPAVGASGPNLTYSGLPASTGNGAQSYVSMSRSVGHDLSSGPLYFSFLQHADDFDHTSWASQVVLINADNSTTEIGVGANVQAAPPTYSSPDDRMAFVVYNREDSTFTQTAYGADLSTGTTYLQVVKVEDVGGQMAVTMWTYSGGTAPASEPGSGGTAYSFALGTGMVDNLGVYSHGVQDNVTSNPSGGIDELRVATTWAEAVPDAGSGGGGGGGGGGSGDLLWYEDFASASNWTGFGDFPGLSSSGTNLSYAALPASSGNAAESYASMLRTVGHDLADGPLYVSFVQQVDAFDHTSWAQQQLYIDAGDSSTEIAVGPVTQAAPPTYTSPDTRMAFVVQNKQDTTFSEVAYGNDLITGTTYLQVVKVEDAGSGSMRVSLWTYDDGTVPSTEPVSGALSFGSFDLGNGIVDNVGVATHGIEDSGSAPAGSLDEIRVGTSWSAVLTDDGGSGGGGGGGAGGGLRRGTAGDPLRVMCIGDSITYGYSPQTTPGGYRGFMLSDLQGLGFTIDFEGTYTANGSGAADVHHGYSCQTIQQVRDILYTNITTYECPAGNFNGIPNANGDVAAKDPEVLLVQLGTNNLNAFVSNTVIDSDLADYESFLRMMLADVPNAFVFVAQVPPRLNEGSENQVARFNNGVTTIVDNLVNDGFNAYVVDNWTGMGGSNMSNDNIHPSTAGFDQMGLNWANAMEAVPENVATGFSDFETTNGLTGGAAGDDDGDGIVNLLEYALGMDPTDGDSDSKLPSVGEANGRLTLSFTRLADDTDIDYVVEGSSDLTAATWTELARSSGGATTAGVANGVVVSDAGGSGTVSVTVTDNTTITDSRFMRVRVIYP